MSTEDMTRVGDGRINPKQNYIPPDSELISLSEAALHTPYSQEYLSLLARKGRILAWKKGRNWFTTANIIEDYL